MPSSTILFGVALLQVVEAFKLPLLRKTSTDTAAKTYTLKGAAAGMFKVGIALNGNISNGGQYPSVSAQHFDLVTAENECKFDKMQPY